MNSPADIASLLQLTQLEDVVLEAAVTEYRTRLNLAAVLFERRDAREHRVARQEHELADGALADAVAEYVAFIDADRKAAG